jgi:hypothetical protein
MKKSMSKNAWIRVTIASLFAFLLLAILIPNTGRIIVDHSTTPTTFIIKDRPQQIAGIVAILLVPLVCIYFGTRDRLRFLEFVGWVLMAGLFILLMQN